MYQILSIHVGKYTGKHLNLSSGVFLNSSASGVLFGGPQEVIISFLRFPDLLGYIIGIL